MLEFAMGVLLSPWLLAGLLIISSICDHRQSQGWGLFWILASGGLAYFAYGAPLEYIGYAALAYIPIGVAWSIFRFRKHVAQIVAKVEDGTYSQSIGIRYIELSENKAKITYWIAAWPVSFVGRILGDIYDTIESIIVRFFKGTYARIAADGEAKIKGIK